MSFKAARKAFVDVRKPEKSQFTLENDPLCTMKPSVPTGAVLGQAAPGGDGAGEQPCLRPGAPLIVAFHGP